MLYGSILSRRVAILTMMAVFSKKQQYPLTFGGDKSKKLVLKLFKILQQAQNEVFLVMTINGC